jgi:16S rRNA (guanine527-N7)-methyltransferase
MLTTDAPLDPPISPTLWTAWHNAVQELGIVLPEQAQDCFERFYALLSETNRQFNLTRITEPEDYLYRHLLDSLSLVPLIPQGAFLADVGSGPGFPAIPLAIARPDLTVLALESIEKKCRFIQNAKETLELTQLTVERSRAEDLARIAEKRDFFDVVTARAVASLPTLLELCLPLIETGGVFLAMKGRNCQEEIDGSKKALRVLGGKLQEIRTFAHPRLEGSRLLVIEKTKDTPENYPRPAGLPSKAPL